MSYLYNSKIKRSRLPGTVYTFAVCQPLPLPFCDNQYFREAPHFGNDAVVQSLQHCQLMFALYLYHKKLFRNCLIRNFKALIQRCTWNCSTLKNYTTQIWQATTYSIRFHAYFKERLNNLTMEKPLLQRAVTVSPLIPSVGKKRS